MRILLPKALGARSDSVALPRLFLFRWIALPADTISSSRNTNFSISMSSGKRKNGADARAKNAALLFLACERNPDPTG